MYFFCCDFNKWHAKSPGSIASLMSRLLLSIHPRETRVWIYPLHWVNCFNIKHRKKKTCVLMFYQSSNSISDSYLPSSFRKESQTMYIQFRVATENGVRKTENSTIGTTKTWPALISLFTVFYGQGWPLSLGCTVLYFTFNLCRCCFVMLCTFTIPSCLARKLTYFFSSSSRLSSTYGQFFKA